MNSTFWWLQHDWVKYKVPVAEGRVFLPREYLACGFKPNMSEMQYRFLDDDEDDRLLGDFSQFMGGSAFFVNANVYRKLEEMFERCGRAYRVRCNAQNYYVVLIDTLHDAIDLKSSRFERFSGNKQVAGDISRLFTIALKKSFETDDDIFRLTGSKSLSHEVIVSDRFKQRYSELQFTGLIFRPTNSTK